MNRRALGVGLAVATLGCAGAGTAVGGGRGSAARGTPVIRISDFQFLPREIVVTAGDSVAWQNTDSFAHTTTADGGAWSSPEFSVPGRFVLAAPPPGRYPYHCAAHPNMKGVVIVTATAAR
jgi:plastocyanin